MIARDDGDAAAGLALLGVMAAGVLLGCVGILLASFSNLGKSWVWWWGSVIALAPPVVILGFILCAAFVQLHKGQ